ncbi:ABC transporter permease [Streptomyces glaucosporus]|uniref:ABC transporter permease n=1 Tax=Streptomyces glaucosporus TaxID=284044 RepID=A0ABP5UNW6_9ACTN
MFALALRSVRKRPGRFAATLLSAFLGAVVVMVFNSLHDTVVFGDVDPAGAEMLGIAAGVVGGYGTLLVFFAVASALTVNVRQRAAEIALLRSAGATPAQLRSTVVGEAVVVALAGTLLAAVPAALGGRLLLGLFQDGGQVARDVEHVFGPIALGAGAATTLLASAGAALLAVHRAARDAAGARRSRGRARTVMGCAALVAGAGGVATTFALDPAAPALMAAPAYGSILLATGLALLSPALLRALLGPVERAGGTPGGASVHLAVHNLRRNAARLSGILMPMVLFTGIATATLSIQAAENDAMRASGVARTADDRTLETLNLTIVGIIVVFACVMLVNSLYAATSHRRGEFGRQRLAGATPAQVLGTVGAEGVVLTAAGVLLGTVAGLAGTLAFTVVRTDEVLPDRGPAIWLGVAAVAAAATLATSLATARRALRVPAVRAAAVTA